MFKIADLKWEQRYRLPHKGHGSFVVPFATNNPANIVHHGEAKFYYAHYGIHLGKEDRLTFLGSSTKAIKAAFVDCRANSATYGVRETVVFSPSSGRTLVIPPGIAHTFFGMENVVAVNDYGLYVPSIDDVLAGTSAWSAGSDVINIPLDVQDVDLPKLNPNVFKAAGQFYNIVRERQLKALSRSSREHTINCDQKDEMGGMNGVEMHGKPSAIDAPVTESIEAIFGLRWEILHEVRTSDHGWIVPIPGHAPFQIVDHGKKSYATDSYDIHLGQEDRLIFLGNSCRTIKIKFLDCREQSPTLHQEIEIDCKPNPRRCLVIPPGIAHGFSGLEGIFTLNRPNYYLNYLGTYLPETDVLDWPYEKRPFPRLKPNRVAADIEFCADQAIAIARVIAANALISTATGYLFNDERNGKSYKVTTRKKRV